MKILVMNWRDAANPAAGGAEVYTHEIAAHWSAAGHDVTILTAGFDGAEPYERRPDGVAVYRVGSRWSVYRAARSWWQEIGVHRGFDLVIDEVNTHPFFAAEYVRTAPVVAFVHQVCREVWWHQAPLPMAIAGRFVFEPWWLSRLTDVPIITVSDSSKASLERYGCRNIAVVPEGGETHVAPAAPREKDPTLMFIGRLVAAKRPLDALRAFSVVRDSWPTAKLWLAGAGPARSAVDRRKFDGVEVLGRIGHQERSELMARADLLVVTSVREGWGLVVSEAAAAGTLSAGYDVPGLRDSITATGGLLSPPDPVLLGEVISAALADRSRLVPTSTGVEAWETVADIFLTTALSAHSLV